MSTIVSICNVSNLRKLMNAPSVFYGSDINTVDENQRGAVVGSWARFGFIEPTGNMRTETIQVPCGPKQFKDKTVIVKEWRKTADCAKKVPAVISAAKTILTAAAEYARLTDGFPEQFTRVLEEIDA